MPNIYDKIVIKNKGPIQGLYHLCQKFVCSCVREADNDMFLFLCLRGTSQVRKHSVPGNVTKPNYFVLTRFLLKVFKLRDHIYF